MDLCASDDKVGSEAVNGFQLILSDQEALSREGHANVKVCSNDLVAGSLIVLTPSLAAFLQAEVVHCYFTRAHLQPFETGRM